MTFFNGPLTRAYSFLKVRPRWRSSVVRLAQGAARLRARARRGDPLPELFPAESSEAWVKDWNIRSGSAVWTKIGSDEEIHHRPARNLRGYFDPEYRAVQHVTSKAPFLVEIPQGHVVGEHGVVVTPDGDILMDVSFPIGEAQRFFNSNATPYQVKLGGQTFRYQQEFNVDSGIPALGLDGTVALLTSHAGRGYFHWMFDVLPRLELLKMSGHDLSMIGHFVVPMTTAGFHFETLRELGVPKSKLVSSFKVRHLVADRLLAPSLTRPAWAVPTWVVEFLRKSFRPAPITGFRAPRRIYIVRKSTDHGVIEREDELTGRLRARGFEPMAMEDYTLREKAWILANAEAVIGPSGAGLSNIVFCQPGTKVVEIRTQPFPVKEPWSIASQCNLDFFDVLPPNFGSTDTTLVGKLGVVEDDVMATLDLAGL